MVGLIICYNTQRPGGVYGHGDIESYLQENIPKCAFSSMSWSKFLLRLRMWLLLLNLYCLILWTLSMEEYRQLDALQAEIINFLDPPFVVWCKGILCVYCRLLPPHFLNVFLMN